MVGRLMLLAKLPAFPICLHVTGSVLLYWANDLPLESSSGWRLPEEQAASIRESDATVEAQTEE